MPRSLPFGRVEVPEKTKTMGEEAYTPKKQLWERHHYGTVARWIKEVALLFLASLVVQRLFSGSSLADPVMLVGAASSTLLYAFAIHLLLKS